MHNPVPAPYLSPWIPRSKAQESAFQQVSPGHSVAHPGGEILLDSMFPGAMDQWGELSPPMQPESFPVPFWGQQLQLGSPPFPPCSLLLKAQIKNVNGLSELPINLSRSGPFPHHTYWKTEVRGMKGMKTLHKEAESEKSAVLPTCTRRKSPAEGNPVAPSLLRVSVFGKRPVLS